MIDKLNKLDLNLNIHTKAHLYRAALEGIAFSFMYGMEILINDNFVGISYIKFAKEFALSRWGEGIFAFKDSWKSELKFSHFSSLKFDFL